MRRFPVPALPASVIEPIWDQFAALLPPHVDTHPLGCHRPRIPDRLVFDKLVQVLVFGCAYHRIADATCSASTLRRRRDAWLAAGIIDQLATIALDAYDLMIGLDLTQLAVDGCITKAPCGGEEAGRSPVERGKQGRQRSTLVDGPGLPLGSVIAPAARHDSPLLEPTLDHLAPYAPFPEPPTVHLDRGYDFPGTPARLAALGLVGEISRRGAAAPVAATGRWIVERTHAWLNAFKKLVWGTERRLVVLAFWLTFAAVVVIVRRLVREGWMRYRWDGRPARKP
jgi:transposase